MHAPAVGSAAKTRLEPGERKIQRGIGVGSRGLRPDDRPAGAAGELDPGPLAGESRIVFLADLDVDAGDLAVELGQLRELFLGVGAEPLGQLRVPALHDNVHATASSGQTSLRLLPRR